MSDLVLHPETGGLAKVVQTYEPVELSQLEAEVVADEAALAASQAAHQAHAEQTAALEADVAAKEAALEGSKSQLEVGRGLVATPTDEPVESPADEPVADTATQSGPQF